MNIWLIRHGMTLPGEEGRYQGFLDESLSKNGRKALMKAPQKPSHIYVSPAKRARETASILFPDAEQICVPGLWEMNFGVFEGRTWKEMENDRQYREWVDGMCLGICPGGESRAAFSGRVCAAFLSVLDMEKEWQNRHALNRQAKPDAAACPDSFGPADRPVPMDCSDPADCPDPMDCSGPADFESRSGENLFIVSHGGTQMAILEKWGRPARDYYDWQRPCGCGWLLALKKTEHTDLKTGNKNGAGHDAIELQVLEEIGFVKAASSAK